MSLSYEEICSFSKNNSTVRFWPRSHPTATTFVIIWDWSPQVEMKVTSHSPWHRCYSFPLHWPLHKPFVGGETIWAQHYGHFTEFHFTCEAVAFVRLTFCCLWHLFSETWKSIPLFDCLLFKSPYCTHCRVASLLDSYITYVSPASVSHCADCISHYTPFLYINFKSYNRVITYSWCNLLLPKSHCLLASPASSHM